MVGGAKFTSTNLTGAYFWRVNLTNVDLSGADLTALISVRLILQAPIFQIALSQMLSSTGRNNQMIYIRATPMELLFRLVKFKI